MSDLVVHEPPQGAFTDAGGVRFHHIGLGSGAPTVFLHGGGPGCTGWTDFGQVAPLFAADRQVVLVDLLQYGKSEKVAIHEPVWSYHSAKVVAFLDALGLDRVDIVCNSWGGTIALCLAAHHPERVRKLVVTGSMPVTYGPLAPLPEGARRGRNARDAYYGGEGPTWEKMRQLMARLEWYDESRIPERTVTMRYEQSIDPGELALGSRQQDRGIPQDLTNELRTIEAHTLFCWGMYDAFLTPDYALMLANMVTHGHLYVMDRASHHLQEERPHDYWSVVSGFLSQEDAR